MKTMKRVLALIAIAIMMLTMAACGTKEEAPKGDLAAIQEAGKLVVGVTVYEPMNYLNDDGAWDGFDTEFANAVAKKLGVEAQFVIIDWDNKWATLNSKKIDVVWNGMTLSDEAKANASCTNPYVMNAQVVVMKADKLDNYTTAESMKGVKFAVEAGSTGKDIAAENNYSYKEYPTMSDAMSAVKSGKQEAESALLAAARVVADDVHQCLTVGECEMPHKQGVLGGELDEIGAVIAGATPGRTSDDQITVFDSTGLSLQDLATIARIVKRAEAEGIGTTVQL